MDAHSTNRFAPQSAGPVRISIPDLSPPRPAPMLAPVSAPAAVAQPAPAAVAMPVPAPVAAQPMTVAPQPVAPQASALQAEDHASNRHRKPRRRSSGIFVVGAMAALWVGVVFMATQRQETAQPEAPNWQGMADASDEQRLIVATPAAVMPQLPGEFSSPPAAPEVEVTGAPEIADIPLEALAALAPNAADAPPAEASDVPPVPLGPPVTLGTGPREPHAEAPHVASQWPRTGPMLASPQEKPAVVAPSGVSPSGETVAGYPDTGASSLAVKQTVARPPAEFEGIIRSPQLRAQHDRNRTGLH